MADKLMVLLVTAIRENPSALREVDRQSPKYLEFAESVRKNGVMVPILVREIPSPEGGEQLYGLIDGLQRYTASLDAGFTSIPANVRNMEDLEAMKKQLILNAQKIETKPVEYSTHLKRILASDPLMTMTQLAGDLSRSPAWLSERLGLTKLTEEIGKLVDGGKINLTNGYTLAKLPPDEQPLFVERAMTMAPAEFSGTVLARKREIDHAHRVGRDPKDAEFKAVPHMQKASLVKDELEKPTVGPVLVRQQNLTTAEQGFAAAIAWVMHMDPQSIEDARAKDAASKKAAEEKRVTAAAERAKKRAEEAADAAAKIGQPVGAAA